MRFSRAELRDPVGIRFWPLTVSRDPARTPMLWDNSAQAGFTTGKPWLPINDDGKNLREMICNDLYNGSVVLQQKRSYAGIAEIGGGVTALARHGGAGI
ncbi:MAG: hypothetical protein U1F27_01295 [Turneriella sp.]